MNPMYVHKNEWLRFEATIRAMICAPYVHELSCSTKSNIFCILPGIYLI